MPYSNYEFDIFISYAVEDKIDIVTELVEQLKSSGLKVWFAGQELRVGKSINEVIKDGLNKSRYGVVILTHNYFTKEWPRKELHALWGKSDSLIIPIWHNLTTEEVQRYDPILADKWGIETSKGINAITSEIIKVIREHKNEESSAHHSKSPKKTYGLSLRVVTTTLIITTLSAIWFFVIRDLPSDELINETIEKRIINLQTKITNDHEVEMNQRQGFAATIQQLKDYHERYENLKSQYRNEYHLNTGYKELDFKKNVEPAIGIEIDHLTPYNNFGFTYPNIFAIDYNPSPHTMDVKTILINTQAPEFTIINENKSGDEKYLVGVQYVNNIRYLSIDLTYSKRSDWIKRREYTIQGLLPIETYRFEKENGQWIFVGID